MPEWRNEIVLRLRDSKLRPEAEAELVEELSQHLDQHYEELRAGGQSDESARAAAIAELDVMNVESAARAKARPWRGNNEPLGGTGNEGMRAVLSDLRFGVRLLLHNRALAAAAVVTLAVGIGANTAIFSAVNAVVLRPLPFPHPEQLYKLWEENPEKGWYKQTAAPANYLDWKEGVAAFQDVAAYTAPSDRGGATLLGEGAPQLVRTAGVTGNFFSVMKTTPLQGRFLTDAETWSGTEPVAVVSETAWRQKFGARPIVGTQIRVGGTSYKVVGIARSAFAFPNNPDVWIPMGWDHADRNQVWFRRAHWLEVVARAKPGMTNEQANAQLQAVVERLKKEYPETNRVMGAGMTPLQEFIVGDTRTPLLVLLSAVGLLLLIACANVGNLLLVKAASRSRELAVRTSLGATRARLTRQLLTEGLVLAAAGGVAGVGLGWLLTRLLERLQPLGLLPERHFAMDASVIIYVMAVTLIAGLFFGAIPALSLRGNQPGSALRDSSRSGAPGRGARRTANVLVVSEVAIAVMLVIGAGLLVRTFIELQKVNPGVDTHGVLAVSIALQTERYDSAFAREQFYNTLDARAAALPGVSAAAVSSSAPLESSGYTSDFSVAGRNREDYGSEIAHRMVSPSYFSAMRVPVLAGRPFTTADRADSPPVVIINKATVDRHFKGENPIGKRMSFDKYPDSTSTWRTIVGVVGDEHSKGLATNPVLESFVPLPQETPGYSTLLLRTEGDELSLTPAVRTTIHDIDADLALQAVRTVDDIRAEGVASQRFLMTILLVFAGVALLLAVVGVYGVTAQGARQRRQEIGVRLAMGAQAGDIRRLIVRQGAGLIATGIVAGSIAAYLGTKAISSLLFGVTTRDPVTYVSVAVVLLLTGLLAAWMPARSASRSDPATVLRMD